MNTRDTRTGELDPDYDPSLIRLSHPFRWGSLQSPAKVDWVTMLQMKLSPSLVPDPFLQRQGWDIASLVWDGMGHLQA